MRNFTFPRGFLEKLVSFGLFLKLFQGRPLFLLMGRVFVIWLLALFELGFFELLEFFSPRDFLRFHIFKNDGLKIMKMKTLKFGN